MRRLAAVVAAFTFVVLAPSCATIVGVEAIPDVDGGSEANVEPEAPAEAPEDRGGDSPALEGGLDAPADRGATADAADARMSDAVEEEAGATCTAPGWGCVPAIPAGFAYELVDRTDTAGCAAGLTSNDVVASASGSPAMCTCTCGVGQEPSCTYGGLTANVGPTSCSDGTMGYVASGGCVVGSGVSPMFFQAAAVPPMGGSCSAAVGKSVPLAQETKWRTCAYSGSFGGGCPAGEVCAPVATGLSSCVAVAGNVSCPTAYPNQSTVGTAVSDTRDCGACTCAAPTASTCSSATLTFYADTACVSPTETVAMDSACHTLAGSTYGSYKYVAAPSESCGAVAQPPSAIGSVSITGTTTVCCAP